MLLDFEGEGEGGKNQRERERYERVYVYECVYVWDVEGGVVEVVEGGGVLLCVRMHVECTDMTCVCVCV